MVNGTMYITASARVAALDAVSGKEVWSYTVTGGRPSTRGVAYWPGDKENPPRIIFTAGQNLIALNANSGKLDPGFGKEGIVDMKIGYGGVPTVFRNVITVGACGPRSSHRPSRRYARLRRSHRRQAVELSHRSRAWGSRS